MLFVKDAPKENLIVRGARVLDPVEGLDNQVDVKVDDGVIAELGSNLPQNSHRVIDGTGLVLAPGFVDPHCPPQDSRPRGRGDDRDRNAGCGRRRLLRDPRDAEHGAGRRLGRGARRARRAGPR
jgi:imidazolonepropionase-like amidohydrolase